MSRANVSPGQAGKCHVSHRSWGLLQRPAPRGRCLCPPLSCPGAQPLPIHPGPEVGAPAAASPGPHPRALASHVRMPEHVRGRHTLCPRALPGHLAGAGAPCVASGPSACPRRPLAVRCHWLQAHKRPQPPAPPTPGTARGARWVPFPAGRPACRQHPPRFPGEEEAHVSQSPRDTLSSWLPPGVLRPPRPPRPLQAFPTKRPCGFRVPSPAAPQRCLSHDHLAHP